MIEYLAKLANLPLSEKEKKLFDRQCREILQFVDQLKEVKTVGVQSLAQVAGLENIWREDEVRPGLTTEEALQNAPASQDRMFKVKQILKTEE